MSAQAHGALDLDEDELVACVACGLCLPHCPTYRVTGLETASPRGRIAAMQAVDLQGAPIDATFERYMEECVQCRGCEAACPSSVPFGHLMEGAREALDEIDGLGWLAEVGVGTVHVAAEEPVGLVAARAAAVEREGWLLREAGAPGVDGYGAPLPNIAILERIRAAFDPTGKLSPGRLPGAPGAGAG